MKNIFNYFKKYGNTSFEKEKFNEIDNLVLSQLTYLDFNGIVTDEISLNRAIKLFLKNNKYKDVKKLGIAQKEAYLLIEKLIDVNRYKDIKLSNYFYIGNKEIQFSAITFKYKKKFIYIGYEGTDDLISGWKEDFNISYMFPTLSHTYAINYLNNAIKLFDRNIIVGGHSKGGNLALVASMYCKKLIKLKIKKIYNNDGPGLRLKEFNSRKYKKIKRKYIHIVPNYSYFGVLLRDDNYYVIKSYKKNIMAHSMLTWEINNNKFTKSTLSTFSKNLQKGLLIWLDKHTDEEIKKIIEVIFRAVEECKIDSFTNLTKIGGLIAVSRKMNSIDKESKELFMDLIRFNITYLIENRKNKD